jgi:hypothetical protein
LIGYFYHRFTMDPNDINVAGLLVLNLIGCAIFVTKCATIILVQMWVRWTFPRPRIDQVLYACVKVLLPLACVLLLGATIWQLFVPERAGIPWQDYNPWNLVDWNRAGAAGAWVTQVILALIGVSAFLATTGWIVYSFATGREIKQRLTDPDPIVTEADSLVKA